MISHSFGRLLGVGAGVAILAGCSFGGNAASRTSALPASALPGTGTHSVSLPSGMHVEFGPSVKGPIHRGGGWISAKAGQTPIIYGASYNGGFINIYALHGQNQTVMGQLTNSLVSPQGMVVDGQHRLWVANTNASDIVAFQRGSTTPFTILDDANEYPVAVAVDESGNVYAANAQTTSGGNGSVTVWKRGHTEPTGSLTTSDLVLALGIGVDAQGDLYLCYIGQMGPAVAEFPKGSQTGSPVGISDFSISDIIFDDSADLVMENGQGGLGFWTTPYGGLPAKDIPAFGNEPTFNVTEQKVWVALANATTPEINEYDVNTGLLIDTITNGYGPAAWPFGIAIDPRASLSH